MPEIGGAQTSVPETDNTKPDEFLMMLKRKEEAGMARTKNWSALWQDSLRWFLSEQMSGKPQHKDWDWVVLNYIWPSIMQEMAKLSRNYKVVASPTESSDTEAAEAWQGFLQWQWNKGLHKHGMRIEQLRAILDGKLYGYRVSKIYWEGKVRWDAKQRQWLGDVRHRLWHPAEFWASDKEYINDGDCGTFRYVELEYAKSQWPEFADKLEEKAVSYAEMLRGGGEHIKGQTSSSGTYPSVGTGGSDAGPGNSPTNQLLDLVLASDRNFGFGTEDTDRKYCRISETYLKDYTEVDKSEQIPADAQMLLQTGMILPGPNGDYIKPDGMPMMAQEWPVTENKWVEPQFPNGRYIIRNEDAILNPDIETQIYPHSSWPFIVIPHYLLPHMWQGTDAVTLYRSTQDMINVTVSHLVNNMKQFGDPRIALEEGVLATPPAKTKKFHRIFRGAGAIIKLRRGGLNRYRVEQPVPPSAAALQLYGLFAQEYKNFVGLQDIAQGKRGKGITATEAQFLAISANDRIVLQNIFEEEWVRQMICLTAEMDQVYYDVGRLVRIIGDDQVQAALQITQQLKDSQFDIDIEPGQSLPYDEEKRILKYEKAYMIMGNPMPNPMMPEMLRVLGIPSWQKLLAKHQGFQLYSQFQQLYDGVKAGKIAPQDAIRMVIQRATQMYMQEQANTVPVQEPENKKPRPGQ